MPRRTSLLLLALAPTGCFSASSGGATPDANFNMPDVEFPDSPTAEAGTPDATVDGSMDVTTPDVMVVEASADGPAAVDAAPDASIDAGPQPVTILVTNSLGPEPGVTVVFQDPTGAVTGSFQTGVAGTASQLVTSGSQVTVVLGPASAPSLFTVEGLAQGDTLNVYDPASGTQSGQVSVDTVPAGSPAGTASYLALIGNCGSTGSAPPIPIFASVAGQCITGGQFPVLVSAIGGADAGNATLGYTWQKGNTMATDGGVTHVTMNGTWSGAALDTQTVATGAPPAFATTFSDNAYLTFGVVANGVSTFDDSYFGGVGSDTTGVSWPFTYVPGYPDAVQGEALVTDYGTSAGFPGVSVSAIATRVTPPAGSATTSFDLSQLLPPIAASSLDSTNIAQPTVTWEMTDAGSIASAAGAVVAFRWSGSNAGVFVNGMWTIVAPPTASTVQAPALPAGQSAWAPFTGATFGSPPTVLIVEATFLPGYTALREQAGTVALTSELGTNLIFSSSNPAIVPPLPLDGTLVVTAFTQNGD